MMVNIFLILGVQYENFKGPKIQDKKYSLSLPSYLEFHLPRELLYSPLPKRTASRIALGSRRYDVLLLAGAEEDVHLCGGDTGIF